MDLDEVQVDSLVPKPLSRGKFGRSIPVGVRAATTPRWPIA